MAYQRSSSSGTSKKAIQEALECLIDCGNSVSGLAGILEADAATVRRWLNGETLPREASCERIEALHKSTPCLAHSLFVPLCNLDGNPPGTAPTWHAEIDGVLNKKELCRILTCMSRGGRSRSDSSAKIIVAMPGNLPDAIQGCVYQWMRGTGAPVYVVVYRPGHDEIASREIAMHVLKPKVPTGALPVYDSTRTVSLRRGPVEIPSTSIQQHEPRISAVLHDSGVAPPARIGDRCKEAIVAGINCIHFDLDSARDGNEGLANLCAELKQFALATGRSFVAEVRYGYQPSLDELGRWVMAGANAISLPTEAYESASELRGTHLFIGSCGVEAELTHFASQ